MEYLTPACAAKLHTISKLFSENNLLILSVSTKSIFLKIRSLYLEDLIYSESNLLM